MRLGLGMVLSGILIIIFYFAQVIILEGKYLTQKKISQEEKKLEIIPADNNFSVIIPKIGVNAKVIPNIDPYNKKEYLQALSQGVAQASGSATPNQKGNVFIFAHSTDSPANITRFNAIFYLLDKLEKGDSIYLFYQGITYEYKMEEKKIIDPSEIQYLEEKSGEKTLTLMTCYPAGTTLKRLLVVARMV